MRRNLILLLIAMSLAAAAQSLSPPLARLYGKPPWLLASTLYFGIVHPGPTALIAAVTGGLLLDGLSNLPMGVSPALFALTLAGLPPLRQALPGHFMTAVALAGTATAPALTLLQYAVLRSGGFAPIGAAHLTLRVAAAAGMGCATAILTTAFLERLDRGLNNLKPGKDVDAIA